ncbi:MAG: tape measure protein [Planctomycetaceae bacterium]
MRELNQIYKAGALDAQNYNREVKRLGDELRRAKAPATLVPAGMGGSISELKAMAGAYVGLHQARDLFATSMRMEDTQQTFEVFTGSIEQGRRLFSDLVRVASTSPITFDRYAQAAQTLLSYNASIDTVLPSMRMLADLSAGNSERFSRLAMAYGQVTAAGILQGDENRQLIEAGFNPLAIIAERTGQSMRELKDQMADGAITVDMVTSAMAEATGPGGRFYGLIESRSKTASGSLGQLRSEFELFKSEIGSLYHSDIAATFKAIASGIGSVRSAMGSSELSESTAALVSPATQTMHLWRRMSEAWQSNAESFEASWAYGAGIAKDFYNVGAGIVGLDWDRMAGALSGDATMAMVDALENIRAINENLVAQRENAGPKADRKDFADIKEVEARQRATDATAIEELDELKERNLELAMGAEWLERHRLMNSDISDSLKQEIQHARDLAKELERQNEAKEQTERDAKRAEADSKRAIEKQKADAERAAEQLTSRLESRAEAIRKSFLSPSQALAEEFLELQQLAERGLITTNELALARKRAADNQVNDRPEQVMSGASAFSTDLYSTLVDQQRALRQRREDDQRSDRLILAAQRIIPLDAQRLATQQAITDQMRQQALLASGQVVADPASGRTGFVQPTIRPNLSNQFAAGSPQNATRPGAATPAAGNAELAALLTRVATATEAALEQLDRIRLETA